MQWFLEGGPKKPSEVCRMTSSNQVQNVLAQGVGECGMMFLRIYYGQRPEGIPEYHENTGINVLDVAEYSI